MSNIASVSRTELSERRSKLRRQRRLKVVQAGWRLMAVSALAGGLVWAAKLPTWMIRESGQVQIEGNNMLSDEMIQALLPIAYPEHLLELQPRVIKAELEHQTLVAKATVTRHLFPPGLTVQIQEKRPVAILINKSSNQTSSSPMDESAALAPQVPQAPQIRLLDETGAWMSLTSHSDLHRSLSLPDLKVVGMQPQFNSTWPELYQEIAQSPVKVLEVDLRNTSNLILATELGIVYLGPYSPEFPEQLKALDQMRQLPDRVQPSQLDYIDLRDFNNPRIQLKEIAVPVDAETP